MNLLFADTFYWVALTSTQDNLHDRAFAFSNFIHPDKIVTTDEVLVEYLAFFAESALRVKASNTVTKLMKSNRVKVVPQTRETFSMALISTPLAPTKAIA